jgi:hypothetical protein
MILWLHRLRREEEGQTLVLGAVFGIILALCVLGTVNMGRAVYEKIQLQTACDDGAYSQAAVEARVLNLTAYTNRAMVVHYASIMCAQSYLTWMNFVGAFFAAAATALKIVPYIGAVAAIISQIIKVVLKIVDWAVALLTPVIAAANLVLYALQEGAWWSLYGDRLTKIPPEAHSGDSNADAYRPMWPNLIPLANMTVFSQSRGSLTMPQNTVASAQVMLNSNNNAVQEARLHMIEIANSARAPWVAYGDHYWNPSWSPIARHWKISFWAVCSFSLGAVARTELGTRPPSGGVSLNSFGQSYAGSRLYAHYNCGFLGSGTICPFTLSTLDQVNPTNGVSIQSGGDAKGLLGKAINKFIGKALGAVMKKFVQSTIPITPSFRIMWISPYVFFSPSSKAGPAGGFGAVNSGLGNFGQPDVIFGLARQRADFNRNPNVFGAKKSGIVKNMGGQVDFSYNGNDWPTIPGLPGPLQLHEGFNALCAAQTYYHRPGDWKEMPNFFNPLWAARLMPVMDSNAGAALGTSVVPLLQQFILH